MCECEEGEGYQKGGGGEDEREEEKLRGIRRGEERRGDPGSRGPAVF